MTYLSGEPHQLPGNSIRLADYKAKHFQYEVVNRVANITLNRPERKNPLTFDSYAAQIFGGQGVVSDETVEQLYREIRPLRIYEGATEVQQLIIARGILKSVPCRRAS